MTDSEQKDEIVIDLKKLWQILWEKKVVCFLIILICTVGMWGSSFFRAKAPVQYQSVMLVRNQFNKKTMDELFKDEKFMATSNAESADIVLANKDFSTKAVWNGVEVMAKADTALKAQQKLICLKKILSSII